MFLMRLNESFNQVRGQILLMDPLPSINVVLSMVTKYEKQIKITSSLNPTETPFACVFQDKNPKIFKKDKPTCAHYGVVGHLKEKCFKLHGYPRGYKKPQIFKASNQSNNGNDHGSADTETLFDTTQITPQSYQQLINFLKAQMTKVGASEANAWVNPVIGMIFSTIDSNK
ncbi:unnamed protein product [Vicia faba]|uniref:Uncharacterized protein n=1 Tax=Vicia faba TaxID=3906 RepID=A0AAV0YTU9_VICFA|nr:unnamed protein product [Vicia faba]